MQAINSAIDFCKKAKGGDENGEQQVYLGRGSLDNEIVSDASEADDCAGESLQGVAADSELHCRLLQVSRPLSPAAHWREGWTLFIGPRSIPLHVRRQSNTLFRFQNQ